VDSCLQVFGESVKEAIYFYVEKDFQIRRSDIPENPEVFSKALASIFGEGAKVIEGMVVERIKQRFKLKIKSKTTFAKAVLAVRAKQNKSEYPTLSSFH
jgi:hypothetical protein